MADKVVHSLRTNVERLGARLGENLAEHSRDLGLVDSFASGSGGGAGKYLENGTVLTAAGVEETRRMLASKRELERTEGLKRVIAMMTKNLPVTSFFPLVTSLLSPTTSLQSRSLISLYIVHCASHAPELALLSINAYQKDLSDPNPLVRAGAISTLAAMPLPDIRELVGLAVQKGARDTAWYVRRATADALRALYRADPHSADNRAGLEVTLRVLFDGATPLTVGAALSAWEELCPTKWDMVHPNYRRWCRMLMDVEEWGQTVLLRVLARYGRTFFLDPAQTGKVDPDAELALKSSEPLLQHLNPAVVSGVVKLHYYLSPPNRLAKIAPPLLRLLRGPPEVAAVVLEDCALIAEERPDLFEKHLSSFFVRFSDPVESRKTRLRVLVALARESNIRVVLHELLTYIKDDDDAFASDAITAIGTCALRVPGVAPECLETLSKLLQSKHDRTVTSAVLVFRTLLRSPSFPTKHASRTALVTRLAAHLHAGRMQDPAARASVYWLVGQYAAEDDGGGGIVEGCGAEIVRLGAKGFAHEAIPAKLQLLTLSAKLLVLSHLAPLTPPTHGALVLLFQYVALVARYDLAYEVRDRARFLAGLVSAGGIGRRRKDDDGGAGAKVVLSAEDFARGVSLEDVGAGQDDGEEEKQTMTGEQVRAVLFEGKAFDAAADRPHSNAQLGTLSLSLAPSGNPHAARPCPFGSSSLAHVPLYPTAVPPSSTPLQGFGSESFRSSGTAPGQAARVVLTPGSGASTPSTSMLSAAAAAERKKVSLNEFFESSSSGSEEEEDDDETEGEDDDESSEGEEEEDEDDEEDEEEDGEDGSEGEDGEESEGSSSSGDDDPSAQAPR
ncbi:adaptin N terminal region-domain-containing protein [Rhodotorula diobovata]|uniref:Adaptin N terminal region-domain-containing protein n=1 Tax=Rhodotorula diobovata TaxID=5288 RepID=A0A5C5FUJ7_9BASI|nr:adaptin N terminal region-domain-containing protein [Rhodotorula diobovata]